MSCGPGMSARIERKRFLQASDGINTCLPDGSGAQSISSGLWTTCTNAQQGASIFALQVWKAICYLYGLILDLQSQAMRTPGTVQITAGAGAGAGASASIAGNDTAGQITLTTGTGASAGEVFALAFAAPYTTAGILHLEAANAASLTLPVSTAAVDGATASQTLSDATEYIWNYVVLGGT